MHSPARFDLLPSELLKEVKRGLEAGQTREEPRNQPFGCCDRVEEHSPIDESSPAIPMTALLIAAGWRLRGMGGDGGRRQILMTSAFTEIENASACPSDEAAEAKQG